MNVRSALKVAFTLPMIDALEELLRKMRPYETEPAPITTSSCTWSATDSKSSRRA